MVQVEAEGALFANFYYPLCGGKIKVELFSPRRVDAVFDGLLGVHR